LYARRSGIRGRGGEDARTQTAGAGRLR
jgi:hypothetical protein